MNDAAREGLVLIWRASTSQRERADVERRLWELRPDSVQSSHGRHAQRRWLAELTGDSVHATMCRISLLNAGSPADPLWNAIDEEGMPISTAVRLLVAARRRGGSLPWGIETVMSEWRRTGVETKTADGATFRRRRPGEVVESPSRFVFAAIRRQLKDHLQKRGTTLKDDEIHRLLDEFEREVDVLVTSYQNRVAAAEQRARGKTLPPSRSSVVDACTTLSIDPPRAGYAVDLTKARRHQRRLGAKYHPDANRGSNHMINEYNAVMKAYAVLEEYNEAMGPSNEEDHHVEN